MVLSSGLGVGNFRLDLGNGSVVVIPVEKDRYGRTVAELFVMENGGEIHLNSEMVAAELGVWN